MLEREARTYAELERLGIPYEKFDHEALFTIEAAEELDKRLGLEICKNLFLYSKNKAGEKEYYLLVLRGHKKFRTGPVSKELGIPRLSFAGEEPMLAYLDITPGSVSPLGLMNDKGHKVQLLVDSDVLADEKVAVHPCVNTATVVIRGEELWKVAVPAWGHSVRVVTVAE